MPQWWVNRRLPVIDGMGRGNPASARNEKTRRWAAGFSETTWKVVMEKSSTTVAELKASVEKVNDIASALSGLRDSYGWDMRDRMDALLTVIPEYAAIQDGQYAEKLGKDLIDDLVWKDGVELRGTRYLVRLDGRVVAVAFDGDGYWDVSRPTADDVDAAIGDWDGITVGVLRDAIDDSEAEPWLIRKVVGLAGDACGVPVAEFDGPDDDACEHVAGIRYELMGGGDVVIRWRSHQICDGCGQPVIEDGGRAVFFDGATRIYPEQHGCGELMGGPAGLWLLDRVDDEADPVKSLAAVIHAVWQEGPEDRFIGDDDDDDDEDETL